MIAALRSFFSLPLLAKELVERAARPRTYWVRVGAALLLYGGFWFENDDILKASTLETMSVLGAGAYMFTATVGFLFVCIGAFVPAMLCGVITQEKERDSLVLLLLTRMKPWQIVLQKYLGGLVPALTLLLLAMPLVAVAYAYGGVSTDQVAKSLLVLILAMLQVGAIAIWASCRFRTTVTAFLMAYFVGAAFYGLPALFIEMNQEFDWEIVARDHEWIALVHFPPEVVGNTIYRFRSFDAERYAIGCGAIALSSLIFLMAAVRALPRRAFDRSKNRLRRIFAVIDRLVHRANRLVGSVTFGRKEESLPAESPIVWRERRARALARPEYLVRLLLVIMIPVVLFSILFVAGIGEQEGLSVMTAILGGLALLTLCTTAANGIVNERVNQTFEVLLTTPLSARQILQQKVRALRPLVLMLSVPILAVCTIEFVMEWEWMDFGWDSAPYAPWIYPVNVLLTGLIYFPLFTWFSVWMGLWCKTRIRAIVTTLIVLIVWFGGPIFIIEEANVSFRSTDPWRYTYLLSPIIGPAFNEFNELESFEPDAPWAPLLINSAFYGGILFLIRRHCLKRADWYLRR